MISLVAQALFYIAAGTNHFVNPQFYIPLIPPYFSDPFLMNWLSGVAEILLGLGLFYKPTRKLAAYGLIVLLFALIPAHVYMIQIGGTTGVDASLNVPEWIAWIRLFPFQFLLMWWAWSARK